MACCSKPGDSEQRKANALINKELKYERSRNKTKLLLLGAGESGKSTIAKQLKVLYLKGYKEEEERFRFRGLVYKNLIENAKAILEAIEQFEYTLPGNCQDAAKTIFEVDEDDFQQMEAAGFGQILAQNLKRLWKEEIFQTAFGRSSEYQLNDTAAYFFDRLDEIEEEDYVPTLSDIVHVRSKTTGISEIEFSIGRFTFSVTDVGGQRSERRKWIHCFQDVTAIIFCAALSEYDQKLYEDNSINRMSEALKLFKDITHLDWFQDTPIILFLNKYDLFKEKIKKVPLSVCFKNYSGENEEKEASDFICDQFKAQAPEGKRIYTHKTIATATDNIQFAFNAVKDISMNAVFGEMGLPVGRSPSYLGT